MSRLAIRRITFFAALAAVLSFPQVSVPGAPGDAPHLPDLIAKKPFNLSLQQFGGRRGEPGRRLIRLSFKSWNAGDGPLELRPVNNPSTQTTDAFQRIYSHDAGGNWYVQSERHAGTFVFHPAHGHWHFDGYARYELLQDAGGVPGAGLRTSTKMSFCIINTFNEPTPPASPEHEGAGGPYNACGPTDIEGMSVGHGDEYSSTLAGQSIDITGIPDGIYWLRGTADADAHLQEISETNNMAQVRIQIGRRGIAIIG